MNRAPTEKPTLVSPMVPPLRRGTVGQAEDMDSGLRRNDAMGTE